MTVRIAQRNQTQTRARQSRKLYSRQRVVNQIIRYRTHPGKRQKSSQNQKWVVIVGVFKSIGPVGADLSKQRDDGGRIKPEGSGKLNLVRGRG